MLPLESNGSDIDRMQPLELKKISKNGDRLEVIFLNIPFLNLFLEFSHPPKSRYSLLMCAEVSQSSTAYSPPGQWDTRGFAPKFMPLGSPGGDRHSTVLVCVAERRGGWTRVGGDCWVDG